MTAASAEASTRIEGVSTSLCSSTCGDSIVEFSVDDAALPLESDPIFSHGRTDRYRLHLEDADCPCACLGEFDCPVARYVADDGVLTLVFYATDFSQLQTIVGELRDRYPAVDIKRFIRGPAGEHVEDTAMIDRSRLTTRQLEVLETAYEMGYFDRPRQANATAIAAELGINPSTFREHLVAAEHKIFADLL
ncbi:MAG: helix-turn-helix domain-containing protein [Natrialbaceae archaeon]|nr:helix-turn-helix domain-containing protein [Natrialbaceae archaeon]